MGQPTTYAYLPIRTNVQQHQKTTFLEDVTKAMDIFIIFLEK